MSCRTGPLRVGRAFARLLTCRGGGRWASRCSALSIPAIGRAVMIGWPRPVYTPRSGRAPRRRPVRQDMGYSAGGVFGLGGSGGAGDRRMRGGAQSQLMLGADGKLWVVKFQNNPQDVRVLANELIATRLAAAVGLTVPASDVVEVTEWLVANTLGYVCGAAAGAAGTVCGGVAVWVAVCGWVDAGAGGGLSAGAAAG